VFVEAVWLQAEGPKVEVGAKNSKKCKKLVDEHDDDAENDETACTDDDAARWLITCLGDCCPSEFVKSAQALDVPIHKGKMDAECACAMWSDAGVGVETQQITMKHFISFFGCKFTVLEASINKLAADSAQFLCRFSTACRWCNRAHGPHAGLLVQGSGWSSDC
jgi:hypothetical protein